MPKHDSYLWEATCIQPHRTVKQEDEGWKVLDIIKYRCVCLVFRPQRSGFNNVSFDFRPELGFCLQWVGWENSVSFCGPSISNHSVTNKIVARQFFETTNKDGETFKRWFEFFYYILADGCIVTGNVDFDLMSVKMKSFC